MMFNFIVAYSSASSAVFEALEAQALSLIDAVKPVLISIFILSIPITGMIWFAHLMRRVMDDGAWRKSMHDLNKNGSSLELSDDEKFESDLHDEFGEDGNHRRYMSGGWYGD